MGSNSIAEGGGVGVGAAAAGAAAKNKGGKQRQEEDEVKECRVCLGNEEEKGNELIAPCACEGSVKWIHRSFLSEW